MSNPSNPRRRQRQLVDSDIEEEEQKLALHPPGEAQVSRAPRLNLPPEVEQHHLNRDRFASIDIQHRYYELRRTASALSERGFRREHLTDDRLQPLLEWLGWMHFAAQPEGMASLLLAVEFYAAVSGMEDGDDEVRIRGVCVRVDPEYINEILQTPATGHVERDREVNVAEPDAIVATFCTVPEFDVRNVNELKVKCMQTPWHDLAMFWQGRVKPHSRPHQIHIRQLRIISAIARGVRPDIGCHILRNMKRIAATAKQPSITHVHIITEMCRRAGVWIEPRELIYPIGNAITIRSFTTRRHKIQTGAVAQSVLVPPQGEVPQEDIILLIADHGPANPPSPPADDPEIPDDVPMPQAPAPNHDIYARFDRLEKQLDRLERDSRAFWQGSRESRRHSDEQIRLLAEQIQRIFGSSFTFQPGPSRPPSDR